MIAGIVPASGASSRMGSPKALLDGGGRSFLERVARALMEGGCAPVFVVVRDTRSPVAAMARNIGARVIENPDPEEGPISSLRRALEALPPEAEACVVLPVDHPLVSPATVAALIRAFRVEEGPGTSGTRSDSRPDPRADARADSRSDSRPDSRPDPPPDTRIVVPTRDGKRGHPVLFPARLFPELMEEGLEEGARTVVHRHLDELLQLPVDDGGILVDIDTLPEYRRRFPDSFRKRFQSR